jgi:hypothetical protein
MRGLAYCKEQSGRTLALATASHRKFATGVTLYLNSSDMATSYSNPKFLWWLCPLLPLWIRRVWVKTSRGEMHDDPVVFAVKDRVGRLIGVFFLLATWLAV